MKLNNITKTNSFFEKVKKEKKISIFSDYDVDGACAAAICKKSVSYTHLTLPTNVAV